MHTLKDSTGAPLFRTGVRHFSEWKVPKALLREYLLLCTDGGRWNTVKAYLASIGPQHEEQAMLSTLVRQYLYEQLPRDERDDVVIDEAFFEHAMGSLFGPVKPHPELDARRKTLCKQLWSELEVMVFRNEGTMLNCSLDKRNPRWVMAHRRNRVVAQRCWVREVRGSLALMEAPAAA